MAEDAKKSSTGSCAQEHKGTTIIKLTTEEVAFSRMCVATRTSSEIQGRPTRSAASVDGVARL